MKKRVAGSDNIIGTTAQRLLRTSNTSTRQVEPFGKCTDEFEDMPSAASIKYADIPKYAEDLPLLNTVELPEEMLKAVMSRSAAMTKMLSREILLDDTVSALSLENTQSYLTAALKDCLGIDIDLDEDMAIMLNALSKVHVIYFFIRQMKIGVGIKRTLMRKMIDIIMSNCDKEIDRQMRVQGQTRQLQQLSGIVRKKIGAVVTKSQPKDDKSTKRKVS